MARCTRLGSVLLIFVSSQITQTLRIIKSSDWDSLDAEPSRYSFDDHVPVAYVQRGSLVSPMSSRRPGRRRLPSFEELQDEAPPPDVPEGMDPKQLAAWKAYVQESRFEDLPPFSFRFYDEQLMFQAFIARGGFGETWLYSASPVGADGVEGPDESHALDDRLTRPDAMVLKTWKFNKSELGECYDHYDEGFQYHEGAQERRARREADAEFSSYESLGCVQLVGESAQVPRGFPRVYGAGRLLQSPKAADCKEEKGMMLEGDQFYYWWIAMEPLGSSLSSASRFKIRDIKHIGLQMLSMFEHLRSKQIVHRDIKPSNLLYGLGAKKDQLHLIDFGFASIKSSTKRGIRTGTSTYMSFRAHRGSVPDHRDDYEGMLWMLLWLLIQAWRVEPWRNPIVNAGNSEYHFPEPDKEQRRRSRILNCYRNLCRHWFRRGEPPLVSDVESINELKRVLIFGEGETFDRFIVKYVPADALTDVVNLFKPLFQHLRQGDDSSPEYDYFRYNEHAPDHQLFVRLFSTP